LHTAANIYFVSRERVQINRESKRVMTLSYYSYVTLRFIVYVVGIFVKLLDAKDVKEI